MIAISSPHIIESVTCAGFSIWSSIAALNNVTGFRQSVAAVHRTASMAPLREAPPIATAFDHRAIQSTSWSTIAVLAILVLQAAAAGLLAAAAWSFASVAPFLGLAPEVPARWGFSLLATCWIAMLTGGLWFGYWIREGVLQLTHLGLLVATLVAALVVSA